MPITAVPGVSDYWRSTQRADAREVGVIFPAGIAWSLWLVYSCPSRVFQLLLAVRQPLPVYPGGSLALAWGADLSGLLPALAFLFKFPGPGSSSMNVAMCCPVSGSCHFSSPFYHRMKRFSNAL